MPKWVLDQGYKRSILLICFDSTSLLVLALLAGLDAFKVVSNRIGKVESHWICLDEVTKYST